MKGTWFKHGVDCHKSDDFDAGADVETLKYRSGTGRLVTRVRLDCYMQAPSNPSLNRVPTLDVTRSGDTEFTLAHPEPNYLYDKHSKSAAGAFADPKDQEHPYASPVYGDFSKGFPSTLIQGGTKEILLSGFIRLYQALDIAGQTVKLDIYEGMPYNFASRIPEAPESKIARKKIADFVRIYLGDAPRSVATRN
jgi:hypothetical protein